MTCPLNFPRNWKERDRENLLHPLLHSPGACCARCLQMSYLLEAENGFFGCHGRCKGSDYIGPLSFLCLTWKYSVFFPYKVFLLGFYLFKFCLFIWKVELAERGVFHQRVHCPDDCKRGWAMLSLELCRGLPRRQRPKPLVDLPLYS